STPETDACDVFTTYPFASSSSHVWVVEVNSGSGAAVRSIARSHSLDYPWPDSAPEKQVRAQAERRFSGCSNEEGKTRRLAMHEVVHRSLERHPEVAWVSYQTELTRGKRDFQAIEPNGRPATRRQRFLAVRAKSSRRKRVHRPAVARQWYLHDTRTNPNQPKLDLHVIPAWRRNLTGRGVVVAVVDDRAGARITRIYDPMPKYVDIEEERHGTARCAAKSPCRPTTRTAALASPSTLASEASKFSTSNERPAGGQGEPRTRLCRHLLSQLGPTDNGATMEAPGPLASELWKLASVESQRQGSHLRVASGNGGAFDDNCNCDGYASSVYTIAVSRRHARTAASMHCAATLATTFSSGSKSGEKMVSTDLRHQCTTEFTGTSASAPIASGIICPAARGEHAIVWTAEGAPLQHNLGWRRTLLDTSSTPIRLGLFKRAAMVNWWIRRSGGRCRQRESLNWMAGTAGMEWQLGRSRSLRCSLTVETRGGDRVKYLEHLQLRVNMTYPVRGNLAIFITSPAAVDQAKAGQSQQRPALLAFMTGALLGRGAGRLKSSHSGQQGLLERLQLVLHGTETQPDHRARAGGFRSYNRAYNSVKNIVIEEDRESVANRLMAYYNRLFDSAQHLGYKNRIRPEPQSWLKIIDNN
uniref:Subtilisin n=1 Tax=Macrostomum lignano TaxID=282301 RepID=A0A1I8FGV4_9PLAT